MQFNTPYDRVRSIPEFNDGEILVERAGYIPANVRIENMILAGQRLVNHRSQFDFDSDDSFDETFFDPTRRKDFDLEDASEMARTVDGRLNASQTARKASESIQKDKEGVSTSPEIKASPEASKALPE